VRYLFYDKNYIYLSLRFLDEFVKKFLVLNLQGKNYYTSPRRGKITKTKKKSSSSTEKPPWHFDRTEPEDEAVHFNRADNIRYATTCTLARKPNFRPLNSLLWYW
jgi:hypothetical protein